MTTGFPAVIFDFSARANYLDWSGAGRKAGAKPVPKVIGTKGITHQLYIHVLLRSYHNNFIIERTSSVVNTRMHLEVQPGRAALDIIIMQRSNTLDKKAPRI